MIHELQEQLKQQDPKSEPLARYMESAKTSALEVERLHRKLEDQQHQLKLYREENHRQDWLFSST